LAANDERICPIYNETNLGLAASLNKALVQAKGKWIARMDADDISLPDRIEMQLDYLKDDPNTDVLGAGAIEVNEQGVVLATVFRPERHDELVAAIYKRNPFIHPTIIAGKRFFNELGGYNPSLRRAQDYDLWLRGHHRFHYHNLQMPLLIYLRRSDFRFSDTIASARVLWSSADREHRWMTHGWYAARPLLAALAQKLGLLPFGR
jgi:glycosyltransferase involved in cell wall biosynthesis